MINTSITYMYERKPDGSVTKTTSVGTMLDGFPHLVEQQVEDKFDLAAEIISKQQEVDALTKI